MWRAEGFRSIGFPLSSLSGFWGSASFWHNGYYPQGYLAGPERFFIVFKCGPIYQAILTLALEPWLESQPSLWCFMVFVFVLRLNV